MDDKRWDQIDELKKISKEIERVKRTYSEQIFKIFEALDAMMKKTIEIDFEPLNAKVKELAKIIAEILKIHNLK